MKATRMTTARRTSTAPPTKTTTRTTTATTTTTRATTMATTRAMKAMRAKRPPKPPAAAAAPLNDDAEVVVVVDGVETKHTLGSLKRLAGQEASLTRKSQEADVVGSRAAIVLQGALESVLEDLKPYEGVDWLVEQQNMEPEEFKWHREQFTRLQGRYQKLVGNAQTFGETMTAKQKAATTERAQKALKVLSDPKDGIPGWNDQVYNDIMAYGISQGLDPNDVAQIADAPVIKLIHQAMMFSKGQKTVAAKVAKVNDTPAKVRKGSGRETIAPEGGKSQRTLERKLASGRASDDDAIALLTGRWGVKGR